MTSRHVQAVTLAALLLWAAAAAQGALASGSDRLYLPLLGPPGVGWPQTAPSQGPPPTATAWATPAPLPSALPPARREDLRWVGELGGGGSAVAVLGEAAYLGEGHRVVVVDLGDPAKLRRAGEVGPFPGYVKDLAIADGRLVVAAGEGGLRVLDLADPSAPREVGALDTPGDARAVVVEGSMAFLADGPGGLRLVDLSDPTAPRLAGHLDTVEEANDVAVEGGRAYLAIADARSAGLSVVDVSDPARPRELGAAPTAGEALGVAVAGGHAYLAGGATGLHVFNVADPARPRRVTTVERATRGVAIHEGRAFLVGLTDGASPGVQVVDLADPAAPRPTIRLMPRGQVAGLAWQGGRLYAATDKAGMEAFTATAGVPVEYLAVLDRPGLWAFGLAVSDDRAYVLDGGTVRVVDVAAPSAPRELGSAPALALPSDPNLAFGSIAARGGHAYLSQDGRRTVRVLDATDPGSPVWLDAHELGQVMGPLDVLGARGYFTDRDSGEMRLADLTQPAAPALLSRLILPCQPMAIRARASMVYLGCEEGALMAVDVANPSEPRVAASTLEAGFALDLSVEGRFLHLADIANGTLRVMDTADPARLREVGRLPLGIGAARLAVAGPVALVSDGREGFLGAIDVGDPAAPRLLGRVAHPGEAYDIEAAGRRLYVADGSGGLQIFEVMRAEP